MRALVIESFQTAKGFIPTGTIVELSESVLEKLRGKVEPVADYHPERNPPFRGAVEIVTPAGESVWVATEPEAVKLIPEGAAYFTAQEVKQLQKEGKETAQLALMVKQVFPGSGPVDQIEAWEKKQQEERAARNLETTWTGNFLRTS